MVKKPKKHKETKVKREKVKVKKKDNDITLILPPNKIFYETRVWFE